MSDDRYLTGAQLLARFNLPTREAKLEQAVKALTEELDGLHEWKLHQSLRDNLENPEVTCSCADAYRMGVEALKP